MGGYSTASGSARVGLVLTRSLTQRVAREGTFRGLKPTDKISRRYRGEDLLQPLALMVRN